MTTLAVPRARRFFENFSGDSLDSLFSSTTSVKTRSLEERIILLLVRDLLRLGWQVSPTAQTAFELVPPSSYEKAVVKEAMAYSRNEIIQDKKDWIDNHIELGRSNLAYGKDVLNSDIYPVIEVCENEKQNNLFRLFRYYWSSPSSDYVGRRIRILIRDKGIPTNPVIGIAAIGSSIIHISDRDRWIGWDTKTRTQRIIYAMDAYVLGALPPYNHLLGGKLISYILASNELRDIYKKKYATTKTLIDKRKASDLALIITTSLYGTNSSQYNRLKFRNSLIYKPIGTTSGYGSLHISSETFEAMRNLLVEKGYSISNKFGMGPNWRMRVIRTACDILKLDSNLILKHSFQRGLFAVPLAVNWKSFLNGKSKKIIYRNMSLKRLVKHWRDRWLNMRKQNKTVIQKVLNFQPCQFSIEQTSNSELD